MILDTASCIIGGELVIRRLLFVLAVLSIAPAPCAAQPAATAEPGITGRVLASDGSPVTQGQVALVTSPLSRVNAAIDRTGHFHIVPDTPGSQTLYVSVPGYAPHRAYLTVPSSRRMPLPDISLLEATYFRARFVTEDGEPLAGAGLRRRTLDIDGMTILDALGHTREQSEPDGSLTVGPLPAGRTQLVFDRPGLAQTRLRDVNVTGRDRVIDGGTIAIAKGAQLHVEIIDGKGQPVPRHEVWLEDVVQPSPLFFMAAKTTEEGRAVFERLAAGRYRVWTRTVERCGNAQLTVSRLVTTGAGSAARTRLVVGGRAAFRITSAIGPVFGRTVTATPESPAQPPWLSRLADIMQRGRQPIGPMPSGSPGCGGVTDSDGRIVLTSFPPGQTQLRVQLFNSAYIVRLAVPESGGEIVINVPDGLIPVRVIDRVSEQTVPATLVWVGGGGRVETVSNANGDALLEAVGTSGGTLTISARGHETLEGSFDQTPDTLQEVRLTRSPTASPQVRVVSGAGDAIAGAIVQRHSRGAGDADEFVAANSQGVAMFTDLPQGPLQFSAHAGGHLSASVRIAEDARASIVITLTPAPRADRR
jgi:hypothetical protein